MSIDFSSLLLSSIPLFVAVGVFGVIPIFLSHTEKLEQKKNKRLVTEATVAALVVARGLLFDGRAIVRFPGITEDDFLVGLTCTIQR